MREDRIEENPPIPPEPPDEPGSDELLSDEAREHIARAERDDDDRTQDQG